MTKLSQEEIEQAFLEYLVQAAGPVGTSKIAADLRPKLAPRAADTYMPAHRLDVNWADAVLQRMRKKGLVQRTRGTVGVVALWLPKT